MAMVNSRSKTFFVSLLRHLSHPQFKSFGITCRKYLEATNPKRKFQNNFKKDA